MDGRVSDGRNGWCRGARRSARRRRSQALGSKPPWKGSSRRSAREQSAGARSLHAARQRPGPNPWHPPRMPCSSASPPRPPAGQPAAKKHLVEGGFSEGKRGLCARSKRKAHVSRREAFCDGSNAHLVWSAQCRRPGSGKLGRKVAHDAPSDAVQGRKKRPSHVTAKSPPLGTPRPDIALEGYETLSRWGGSPVSLLTPRDFAHLTTAAWSDRALGGCNGRMVVSVELWVVCCISDVLYGRCRSRPHRQSRSPSQKRHNHKSNLLELWASTTWACNGRTAISVDVWVYAVTMTCGIRSQHACAAVGTNWSRHKRV